MHSAQSAAKYTYIVLKRCFVHCCHTNSHRLRLLLVWRWRVLGMQIRGISGMMMTRPAPCRRHGPRWRAPGQQQALTRTWQDIRAAAGVAVLWSISKSLQHTHTWQMTLRCFLMVTCYQWGASGRIPTSPNKHSQDITSLLERPPIGSQSTPALLRSWTASAQQALRT